MSRIGNRKITIPSGVTVTVENNGKIAELLIAESAKVMVKGDSIAYRVPVHIYGSNTKVSAFVPLDIESTSTFSLTVGPNGEETAVVVKDEKDIPKVNGIGTISITMTKTGEKKTVIAENDGSLGELPVTEVKGKVLKIIKTIVINSHIQNLIFINIVSVME